VNNKEAELGFQTVSLIEFHYRVKPKFGLLETFTGEGGISGVRNEEEVALLDRFARFTFTESSDQIAICDIQGLRLPLNLTLPTLPPNLTITATTKVLVHAVLRLSSFLGRPRGSEWLKTKRVSMPST